MLGLNKYNIGQLFIFIKDQVRFKESLNSLKHQIGLTSQVDLTSWITEGMRRNIADCFYSSISYILFRILVNHSLKQLTDMALSPWSDIESSTSSQEYSELLEQEVIKYYGLKPNQCMVLGVINQEEIKTAHIWPKDRSTGMIIFNLQHEINNPRNCLRWIKSIEEEFDQLSLTIIEEDCQLKVHLKILNAIIDFLPSSPSYESV